ncbi:meiotic recombination protein SPO11-like [Strongylocentrotus purpuratus]|uniref:DNA topoisomerase (ATP-hydrolyzing) n=1 Tax=Strongylocentrotus purpuratus TaxID=7668 RepID=A0A7M7NQQ8_STRPU|nr:meiotic recombination protein SPO11-like [Strongylocentrotus purpuratus]|eukprot:XP_780029.3 PREDICTED: meiotic recombination protein SPO11-like [Strongylocentrotus purpuratus]
MNDDSQFWTQIDHLTEDLKNEERARKLREQFCQTRDQDAVKYVRTQDITRQEVLHRIEAVVENVVTCIARGEALYLSYGRRNSWDSVSFREDVGLEMKNDAKMTEVRFDVPTSTNRFTLMLKVLALCYRLVQTDTYSTKRDLYYSDVQSFGSQSIVDDIIDNLCCLLQVPRRCLHVLATSKGLVYGDLCFTDASGSYIDCSNNRTGTQVTNHVGGISNIHSHAKFVLIIEKDATFQKIIDDGLMDRMRNCIIITGKGFPDINTRMMVRKLWDTLHIPVFALVDADPHGLAILFVYKFGSRSLSYESHSLTVPSIRWLGVLPSDVKGLRIPEKALVPLSPSDLKKASHLMRRPFYKELPQWMSELQEMLHSGYKAEIQSLTAISETFLTDVYLPTKLRCGGWL